MRLTNSKNCVDAMNVKTTRRVNDKADELSLDPRSPYLTLSASCSPRPIRSSN